MKARYLSLAIIFLVIIGVYLNQVEKFAVDESKIPEKVEESEGFQRWITNLKNKDFEIEADEFRLLEENEIYNTKWMKIQSADDEEVITSYEARIDSVKDVDKVVFSPNERAYLDYREEKRFGYKTNEAYVYGLREDKVLDARVVDCSVNANCYFDRGYFLEDSNDVLVISEFSRDTKESRDKDNNDENKEVDKEIAIVTEEATEVGTDEISEAIIEKVEENESSDAENNDATNENQSDCTANQLCTYTIKLHVIDLLQNKRNVYESKPFEIILSEVKPEL